MIPKPSHSKAFGSGGDVFQNESPGKRGATSRSRLHWFHNLCYRSIMRTSPLLALFVAPLLFLGSALAEPQKVENVVDLLQQAKDSASPIPLLEKAREQMKHYDAGPNHLKQNAAGVGKKAQAAEEIKGRELKHRAMEYINDAIELAKKGEKATSKIDAAIAEVHHTGTLKH
jgi:hypothetical protein